MKICAHGASSYAQNGVKMGKWRRWLNGRWRWWLVVLAVARVAEGGWETTGGVCGCVACEEGGWWGHAYCPLIAKTVFPKSRTVLVYEIKSGAFWERGYQGT